jgi:hypothetical protein
VNAHCKVDGNDAVMEPMSVIDVDKISLIDGFGEAMITVGWAKKGQRNSMRFPNFLEFNEPACLRRPAKTNAERQRKFRSKTSTVTESNGSNDREEKRRSINPLPPKGEGGKESSAFGEFVDRYPKKSKRNEALAQWHAINPSAELAAQILASVENHKKHHPQWRRENGRYVPPPDKWLRDRGWEWKPPRDDSIDDVIREMEARRQESP